MNRTYRENAGALMFVQLRELLQRYGLVSDSGCFLALPDGPKTAPG
jgi:hypothetical protein